MAETLHKYEVGLKKDTLFPVRYSGHIDYCIVLLTTELLIQEH